MMSMNSAYVDELYFDYLRDPETVPVEWRSYFASSNHIPETAPSASSERESLRVQPSAELSAPVQQVPATVEQLQATTNTATSGSGKVTRLPFVADIDKLVPLSSIGGKIAENMEISLTVPTATSFRSIPVKALEENRRIVNTTLNKRRLPKISFTHILAWAIVKGLEKCPNMNNSYGVKDGVPVKVERGAVNLGIAVDTTRKDGSRVLLVPSIKNAHTLNFREFVKEYDSLIAKARTNKLSPEDLSGATVTLTNPGGIGTEMSVPRLMYGQGTIVAAGAIDYPAEFQAMMPEVVASLAISKVVTLTSTYDHRVIQGAESGEFLQHMHQCLIGNHRFYDQLFASFEIPFEPVRWSVEHDANPFVSGDTPNIIDKEGRVVQMIHAYRVRGHMLADINPLGLEAYYFPELDPAYYDFTIWT